MRSRTCLCLALLSGALVLSPQPTMAQADTAAGGDVTKEIMQAIITPVPRKGNKGADQRPKRRSELVRHHKFAALPAFVELAGHADDNVRINALMAMQELLTGKRPGTSEFLLTGEQTAKTCTKLRPLVMEKLQDTVFGVRYTAMGLAGAICVRQPDATEGNRVLLNYLLGVVFSRLSPLEKAGAVRALAPIINKPLGDVTHPDPEEAAKVVQEVRDWYEANRASMGLIALRPAAELMEDLRSKNPKTRIKAAREIEARGDLSYVPHLCKCLQTEPDLECCTALIAAVAGLANMPMELRPELKGEARKAVIAEWITWYQAQPDLKTLKSSAPKERLAVIPRLAKVQDKRVIDVFSEQLEEEDDKPVAQALVAALGKITGQPLTINLDGDNRAQRLARWRTWVNVQPLVEATKKE